MTDSYVRIEREGRLTIITIDRPGARNALNAEAQRQMAAAFDAFEADDEQWIAIVTASGDRAFCAGHDLKQQAESGDMFTPDSGFGGLAARQSLNKPVIAAVNGSAFGGGFELVLACDLVVAASHAVFALPEPRLGLVALGGGAQRLPQIVGSTRARGILFTGRAVPAAEALEIGLVNEVVEGDPMPAARQWARQVLECSPLSIRATKEAMRKAETDSAWDAFEAQYAYPAIRAMFASNDSREGPRAFVEKRKPVWTGR